MSEDSLNLVLQKQSNKTSSGITKLQIKSEKHTSCGGIFPIMEKFDRMLSHTTQVMMHTWRPSNLILDSLKSSWPFAYWLNLHHGVREFRLLRLHHKDSLRKRVFLERYILNESGYSDLMLNSNSINNARECVFITYSLAHIGIMSYFPKDLNILVMHFFFCSMFGWT